jgi:hypothetical protein
VKCCTQVPMYPVISVKIIGSNNEQQVGHTLLELIQHLARNKVHEYVRGVCVYVCCAFLLEGPCCIEVA